MTSSFTHNTARGLTSTSSGNPSEFHGVLQVEGAVSSLTWTSQADEYWNGFTVGTYGQAQTSTAAGTLLVNDIADTSNPLLEVSAAGGQNMAGNSVTLTLPSGASIKVDRDGDYLYDDKGQFVSLGAGDSHAYLLICVAAGLAKFGFIAELLSAPVRFGYLNGIALTIVVNQLPKAFGFSVDADGFLVNDAKLYLQGWPVASDGTVDTSPSDLTKMTSINIKNVGVAVKPTTNVIINANLDKRPNTASAGDATYVANTVASMADYADDPATGTKPDFTMEMNVIDSTGGIHKLAMAFLKSIAALAASVSGRP